ncbi:MAG: signal peptide peptidase SppA [Chloroflexota bacterium]
MQNRGWLIGLSIVVGIVLACAILPLGSFALLLAVGGSDTSSDVLLSPPRWQEQRVSGSGLDRIAIIEVNGVIGLNADAGLFGSSQLTQRQLLSQIRQATDDSRVKAVVLRVNSPGGGVVASDEIHSELLKLRDVEKPLIVSMGSVAASGGYYIAAPADRIYANPDTFTGSLGVIISTINYEEAFEEFGLRQLVYKSGEFKDIGSPSREPSAQDEAILQSIVDQAYQGFVDVIAEGRDLPRERVLEIADGRIYTGQQALDLDLIDELGNLDEALIGAQELAGLEDALIVRYRSADSFRDLLLGALAQAQEPADPLGLRSLTQSQGPKLEYRMTP